MTLNKEVKMERLREALAKLLFDNTGVVYWKLCGHELEGFITEYDHLSIPPFELNLSKEDCMRCVEMRQDLLDVADTIIKSIIEPAIDKALGEEANRSQQLRNDMRYNYGR